MMAKLLCSIIVVFRISLCFFRTEFFDYFLGINNLIQMLTVLLLLKDAHQMYCCFRIVG